MVCVKVGQILVLKYSFFVYVFYITFCYLHTDKLFLKGIVIVLF